MPVRIGLGQRPSRAAEFPAAARGRTQVAAAASRIVARYSILLGKHGQYPFIAAISSANLPLEEEGTKMPDRVALYFDVDNLQIEAVKRGLPFQLSYIIDRIREEGVLAFARAYAEWSDARYVLRDFERYGFELTELPRQVRGKNTADIQIAVDALELALTPNAPDIIVLVSGDRDFVPVVQKLKRYGKRVVGIGIEGATSSVLQSLCDSFIFYDNLLPKSEINDTQSAPQADRTQAYVLMLRAVAALMRRGQYALGSATGTMMRQLDSTFDPERYGKTLKQLALEAQEAGYIRLIEHEGVDMRLEPLRDVSDVLSTDVDEAATILRFDTTEEALTSYRRMLAEKRVPLIPWAQRELLVRHLWDRLVAAPIGLSFSEMADILATLVRDRELDIPIQAIQKLLYTLNIAACFSTDGSAARYYQTRDFANDRFLSAVDIETAIEQMHQVYLKGFLLANPSTPLLAEAVALLLFDALGEEMLDRAKRAIEPVEQERRVPPSLEPHSITVKRRARHNSGQ